MGPQPRPSPGARSIDWRTNALAPVTAAGTLCPWARAQAIALEKAQPVPWVELELRRGAESVSTYSTGDGIRENVHRAMDRLGTGEL